MFKIDLEKSNFDNLKYLARYVNLQNTTISFQNIHLIDKLYQRVTLLFHQIEP